MLKSIIKAVIEADSICELNPNERGFVVEIDVETWHTAIRGFSDHFADDVANQVKDQTHCYPPNCKLVGKEEITSKLTRYRFFFKGEQKP